MSCKHEFVWSLRRSLNGLDVFKKCKKCGKIVRNQKEET